MINKTRRVVLLLTVFSVALITASLQGASITLTGAIAQDDSVQLFDVAIATGGTVDFRSYGYAGGTTVTGQTIAAGGFDTILTLFSSAGALITENDDGANAATDPLTGQAFDAEISTNLLPGHYILALTQYDNFASGTTLNGGFDETGHSNFTADPSFASGPPCPSGLFRDTSGTAGQCRTGNWAVDFVNVQSAAARPMTATPEPTTTLLWTCGFTLLALATKRRYLKEACLRFGAMLLAFVLAGFCPAHAAQQQPLPTQTGQEPDYTNVDDILNGRRQLLRDDDLIIGFFSNVLKHITLQTVNSSVTKVVSLPNFPSNVESQGDGVSRSGRMFNLPHDVVVSASGGLSNDFAITVGVFDPVSGKSFFSTVPSQIPGLSYVNSIELADFNGDGYADLVINYRNTAGENGIQIATAQDVNSFDKGLNWNFENVLTDDIGTRAMAIGDFNGDGRPEIFGVIPQSDGTGLRLVLHTVNEKTLQISDAVHFLLSIPEGAAVVPHISVAAGKFTASNHDQLLVAYGSEQVNVTAKVKVIDFDVSTLMPQEKTTWDTQTYLGVRNNDDHLIIKTGKLAWNSQNDQAVILVNPNQGTRTIRTLAIDPGSLTINQTGSVNVGGDGQPSCLWDMAIGNFDHTQKNPNAPPATEPDPNLQVSLLGSNCSTDVVTGIFDVDPQSFGLSQNGSYYHIPSSNFPNGTPEQLQFIAGDTQGRSYILGEPTKVTINGTAQPTVVAAAPPMHVDFVPAVGSTIPGVLNLSATPEGFYTTYETDESSNTQSSSTDTTSWSFGAKESAGASVEIGDLEEGEGTKISNTFTAAQDLKGSIDNNKGSYNSHSFDISQKTGFSDQVWYTQSRLNIYIYPVIGKTVCPAGKPNCQDSEKVPLTIQFSGPDQASTETLGASQLEWYQPPWEYGNVLSYPGSYAQLQQIIPNIQKLSDDLTWATDASNLTEKTTWATGSSTGQNTSFEQNYSFEDDFSAQGAGGLPGELTLGGSIELDVSGSVGLSNLNKSSTDLSKSTGIGVSKPGSFLDPVNYGYFVTPYIFGRIQPGGSVDQIPLAGDAKTFGMLQTAFVVDPARNNTGGWWKQTYTTAPDVALNHPARWQITTPALQSPIPSNCLATGTGSSQMDCVTLSPSYPADPWVSEFHQMRGFFISNASSPGQGPQIEATTAGTQLALQARVYNYSLAAMDANDRVHARFYAMPWNQTNNRPAGDSFLIGEDVLSPIPPWSDDPAAPLNWVLARTSFDTTPYSSKYLTFWVVVWTQKADGTLASEIPGHGLTAIPGEAKSLADIQTEPYSNNVGFYNLTFYVAAKSSTTAVGSSPIENSQTNLGKVEVSASRITTGQAIEVSAQLTAGEQAAAGLTVMFYDGDPAQGGKAFDAERVPYIQPYGSYAVRVPYRTQTCGEHQLYLKIVIGTNLEEVHRSRIIRVDCNNNSLPSASGPMIRLTGRR